MNILPYFVKPQTGLKIICVYMTKISYRCHRKFVPLPVGGEFPRNLALPGTNFLGYSPPSRKFAPLSISFAPLSMFCLVRNVHYQDPRGIDYEKSRIEDIRKMK